MVEINIFILILFIIIAFFVGLCAGILVMTFILEKRGEPKCNNDFFKIKKEEE
jgi:uncharacterized protein YneF (UPF0154 family)